MKQNNQNRRARGRGPRKPHGMGGGHNKGQSFDSSGHETRVRGNAYQVLEKYLQLARDAGAAGDRVAAENFLQHADHYYRVLSSMNEGQRPRIGGRELSVADVNVQNVSQGLSAAMYGSGGSGQGLPGMTDNGNQADDGQDQGPSQHGAQHGAQQGGQQGGQQEPRHEHRGQRPDRSQGQHQHGHQRHNQQHSQGRQQGQPSQGAEPSQPNPGNAANGHGSYAETSEQPGIGYAATPEPVGRAATADEQPDYPEELLATAVPPAAGTEPAVETQPRSPRTPRGRLRAPGRRGPKPAEEAATTTGSSEPPTE